MSRFVVYDAATGRILRFGTCVESDLDLQADAGAGEALDTQYPAEIVGDGRWQRAADGSYAPVEPTLDEMKADALGLLEQIASIRLGYWLGTGAPDGGLQVDDISTARINAWATKALISQMTGSAFGLDFWIMADNSHHSFADAAEYLTFASAAADYKTAVILHNSYMKAAIRGAADAGALAAIDLAAGWPE